MGNILCCDIHIQLYREIDEITFGKDKAKDRDNLLKRPNICYFLKAGGARISNMTF